MKRALPPIAAIVVLFALLIAPFLIFGDSLEAWTRAALSQGHGGWVAQLVCAGLLVSDVVLPVPSSLVSVAAGALFGLWPGALISTLGMTLGSILGYGLGRWAAATRARRWMGLDEDRRIARAFHAHGEWMVVMLRPVPVLAEASAIFAGVARLRFGRFLALSVIANAIVSAFYAGLGAMIDHSLPNGGVALLVITLALAALSLAKAGLAAQDGRAASIVTPRGSSTQNFLSSSISARIRRTSARSRRS